MGVTIHYRGSLDDPGRLEDLKQELADIAESVGWKWQTVDDDWSIPPSAKLVHADGRATAEGSLRGQVFAFYIGGKAGGAGGGAGRESPPTRSASEGKRFQIGDSR